MAEEIRNSQAQEDGVINDAQDGANDAPEPTANDGGNGAPTIEELMAQLSAEKAARLKDKAALDKEMKKNQELTKSLRAKQTAQEIEDDAKREEAEQTKAYIAELEAYKHRNEAKERYLLQGMTAELATKAAEAEVKGDMDALADIQKQHTTALLKEKEREWKASRPQLNAGDGTGSGMSREDILAITDTEALVAAIAQNRGLFPEIAN